MKIVFLPFALSESGIYKVGKNFACPKSDRTLKELLRTLDSDITLNEKRKVLENIEMVAMFVKMQDFVPNQLFIWLSNKIDNGRKISEWEKFIDDIYAKIDTKKAEKLLDKLDFEKVEEIDENKLISKIMEDKDTQYIGEKIECTRVLVNASTEDYSYEFQTKEATFVLDAKDLSSPNRLSEALTKKGVLVAPTYIKDVLSFLFLIAKEKQKEEVVTLATQLGWNDEGKFVLPFSEGESFSDSVFYNKSTEKNYIPKGSIDKEMEMIKMLSPNRCFVTVLAILASPILPIIKEVKENPILNLFGTTGSGKTEILTAISRGLFVDPESFYESWGSTENFRLAYALENNNLPIIIDETKKIRDKRELPRELYTLFEGHDKGRAEPKGGIIGTRGVRKFRSVVIITSESSTDTLIDSGAKEGVKDDGIHRRVLDLRVDQSSWFGNLSKNDTIDLKLLMLENHGNFGRMWIKYIYDNKDKIIEDFRAVRRNRNEDLGFKESLLYLFEVVLNILEEKGLVQNKQQHITWLYEDIKKNKRLRESIKFPHNRFLSELREAITTAPHNFGGIGHIGKEQYAKVHEDIAYFTRKGFTRFLKENGIFGEKEAIIKGLMESNNYKETKKTDYGIDGEPTSERIRINRIAINFEDREEEFKGFTIKNGFWVSKKPQNDEYVLFPNDTAGRKDLKEYIENAI